MYVSKTLFGHGPYGEGEHLDTIYLLYEDGKLTIQHSGRVGNITIDLRHWDGIKEFVEKNIDRPN